TTRALRAYQAAWAMRQPATIAAVTMAAARREGEINPASQPRMMRAPEIIKVNSFSFFISHRRAGLGMRLAATAMSLPPQFFFADGITQPGNGIFDLIPASLCIVESDQQLARGVADLSFPDAFDLFDDVGDHVGAAGAGQLFQAGGYLYCSHSISSFTAGTRRTALTSPLTSTAGRPPALSSIIFAGSVIFSTATGAV